MIKKQLKEVSKLTSKIDAEKVESLIDLLCELRKQNGRLFILGVGGGAANASHAVNDFRKICGIETYTPTDNVAELTAITNDLGWDKVFIDWLKVSKLSCNDMILVFSVGGGRMNASYNITSALQYGEEIGCKIAGIVGPIGGYTAKSADICVKIPEVNTNMITPYTESFQVLLLHLIVNSNKLKND